MRVRVPVGVGRSYDLVRADDVATPSGRTQRKDKEIVHMQERVSRVLDEESWSAGGELAGPLVAVLKEIQKGSFQNVSFSFWNGIPQMSFWRKREGRLVLLDSFQFETKDDFLCEMEIRFPGSLQ